MNIFFWFIIIALITLSINIILLQQMNKRKNIHLTPIVTVIGISFFSAALLLGVCKAHGSQVISQTFAASFPIESASYQTQSGDTYTSYTFSSTNGIPFQFDSSEVLSDTVPAKPDCVEVYHCQTRTGFSFCYLYKGESIGYILK